MEGPIDTVVEMLVIKYLADMSDEIVRNATEAFTAGYLRGSNVLKASVPTKAVQKAVQEFVRQYRYKLVEQGILTVSKPIKNQLGDVIGFTTEDINWMEEKPAKMRNQLVDVIEQGIKEGKPAGFQKLASGKYPAGTIAADIQQTVGNYKSDAAMIARTETARCYFGGEYERYAEAGVEYVCFEAAPDCCSMCEPYRGLIMPISSCPHIPLHPQCRCDIRPVLGSELEEYLRNNPQ